MAAARFGRVGMSVAILTVAARGPRRPIGAVVWRLACACAGMAPVLRASVILSSRLLGEHAIGSLESDPADPSRKRLKPRGFFQFCSLGIAKSYTYHPQRWGIGIA